MENYPFENGEGHGPRILTELTAEIAERDAAIASATDRSTHAVRRGDFWVAIRNGKFVKEFRIGEVRDDGKGAKRCALEAIRSNRH